MEETRKLHSDGCASVGTSRRCGCELGQDRRAVRRARRYFKRNKVEVVLVALGFEWRWDPARGCEVGTRLKVPFGSRPLFPWLRGRA